MQTLGQLFEPLYLDNVGTCRATSVLATSMVGVRVGGEELDHQWIQGIGDRIGHGAPNVLEEMFDHISMGYTWVRSNGGKLADCISDVRTSGAGKILEEANGASIVDRLHECALLSGPGALLTRQT